MRAYIKRACFGIAAAGSVVFVLLWLEAIRPNLWSTVCLLAAIPALFVGAVLKGNDALRKQGFNEANIPTTKANLVRAIVRGLVNGFGFGVILAVILYFVL